MGPVTVRIRMRNVRGYDCMFFGIEFVLGENTPDAGERSSG
jgi:hypothetical protein